ncbi:hypothetical protein PLEOSDRAFT_175853 [Pleurotus ostreatus PC15]|uniref:Uncharacterized protein n=1 Tax=Pleurotus ostreatus (strain PC15) TaxID=1137138 RepID=A0A067NTQ2_PLEO1|nr:hypothetical protein PLEOSDRAFT_175853 [Pleurotus ostreatus PC15]
MLGPLLDANPDRDYGGEETTVDVVLEREQFLFRTSCGSWSRGVHVQSGTNKPDSRLFEFRHPPPSSFPPPTVLFQDDLLVPHAHHDTPWSSAASELASSHSSASVSPTTEYVTTDKSLPSSPNGKHALPRSVYPSAAASSSKLRLPFSRKKTASNASLAVSQYEESMSPPRPSYASRTSTAASSDTETSTIERRHLRPPPSRSAIFAAYGGDPRAAQQSTRSLPDERRAKPQPPSPPLPPVPQKRSLFGWYKSQPKSTNASPTATSADESFNLKSFRHVRPGSPTHSNISTASISNLPPPRPRPRGTSTASDSSQRISVAAFREAQARRSQAGSPAPPDLRSASPQAPPLVGSKSYGGIESNRSSSNLSHYYPSSQPSQNNRLTPRRSSVFADDSDSTATSSEEEESDDGEVRDRRAKGAAGVGRRRTATHRGGSDRPAAGKARATRSEMGHNSAWAGDKTSGNLPVPRLPSLTQLQQSQQSRQRASVSTSASMPNAAAKRASLLAGNIALAAPGKNHAILPAFVANSPCSAVLAVSSRHVRDSSVHTISASRAAPSTARSDTDSDTDSDSDNAPLASLVPPRRPGSAMSSASGSRTNLSRPHTPVSRPAPLIDIKSLTTKKPDAAFTAPKAKANDEAFTVGPTLISSRSSTSPNLRKERDGPSPPASFILPPLELDDHSSRFVSSPTSMISSVSAVTASTSSTSKPNTGRSDTASSERLFPRRMESRESNTSRQESGNESVTSRLGKSDTNTSPTIQERRREGLSDRLTKVVQQAAPTSTTPSISAPFKASTPPQPQRHSRRASFDVAQLGENEGDYFSSGGSTGIRLVGGVGNANANAPVDSGEEKEKGKESKEERIAPIVIKQRVPPSSFAVTSRPQHQNAGSLDTTRQRSSTLLPSNSPAPFSTNKAAAVPPSSSSSSSGNTYNSNSSTSNPNNHNSSGRNSPLTPPAARPRSSTMMPLMAGSPNVSIFPMPTKPFAKRTESPASSTGDSSSGRAPLTPRDGSEVGSSNTTTTGRTGGRKEEWGSGVSGLGLNGGKGHMKRQSVTFEDQSEVGGKTGKGGKNGKEKSSESPPNEEQRRKERRRSEAKAAIELGNVINGRGPIVDDDEDDDQPINQVYGARMGMNSMMPGGMPMGMGGLPNGSPGWSNSWQQGQLMPGQFMPPPPTDPTFLVAHQQAMMYAKQAYQMAVAQQAMAAAADEWERSSNIGGFGSGGSVYGGSMYGGSPSLPSMGMGMGGWGSGMMFPPGPRSMYGGAAQSEYGGGMGGGGGGWGSKSVYGESFGPSNTRENNRTSRGNLLQMKQGYGQQRDSTYSTTANQQQSSATPRGSSRPRTTSTPASPARAPGMRKAPPPSSWKASG